MTVTIEGLNVLSRMMACLNFDTKYAPFQRKHLDVLIENRGGSGVTHFSESTNMKEALGIRRFLLLFQLLCKIYLNLILK